jgi:hypothetical protein
MKKKKHGCNEIRDFRYYGSHDYMEEVLLRHFLLLLILSFSVLAVAPWVSLYYYLKRKIG